MMITRPALASMLRWLINLFGGCGGTFIAYGAISQWTGFKWIPLERVAPQFSSLLALMGCVLTAGSIYWTDNRPRRPEPMSYIIAPVVILASLLAIWIALVGQLSIIIVNGFAIVGLAGALLRMQPNPYRLAIEGE